jgi:hypothetical protein
MIEPGGSCALATPTNVPTEQATSRNTFGNNGVVVFMAVEFRKALVDLSSPTLE